LFFTRPHAGIGFTTATGAIPGLATPQGLGNLPYKAEGTEHRPGRRGRFHLAEITPTSTTSIVNKEGAPYN